MAHTMIHPTIKTPTSGAGSLNGMVKIMGGKTQTQLRT
jgi:hypothetical protein